MSSQLTSSITISSSDSVSSQLTNEFSDLSSISNSTFISTVKELKLRDHRGGFLGSIRNNQVNQKSICVYCALLNFQNGLIDSEKASKGLELFGETTIQAKEKPGSFIDIDRLIAISLENKPIQVEIIR